MKIGVEQNRDVKVVTITHTYSVNANAAYTGTINPSSYVPSGYKAILATVGATGSWEVFCYQCHIENGVINIQLRNKGAEALTNRSAFVDVLCVRE